MIGKFVGPLIIKTLPSGVLMTVSLTLEKLSVPVNVAVPFSGFLIQILKLPFQGLRTNLIRFILLMLFSVSLCSQGWAVPLPSPWSFRRPAGGPCNRNRICGTFSRPASSSGPRERRCVPDRRSRGFTPTPGSPAISQPGRAISFQRLSGGAAGEDDDRYEHDHDGDDDPYHPGLDPGIFNLVPQEGTSGWTVIANDYNIRKTLLE